MNDLILNFDLMIKLGLYVFAPMLGVIILSRIIIFLCTIKTRKQNINKYYNIINYWTNLVAIFIALILLAVAVVYVVYFINTMKTKNLISDNKLLFCIVIVVPIVPFSFFLYYLINLIYLVKEIKEQEEIEEPNSFGFSDLDNENKLVSENTQEVINNQDADFNKREEIEIL